MSDNSFLQTLIKNPEKIADLGFDKLREIINEAKSIFKEEKLLLELNIEENQEAYIIGDIHGNLNSLKRILNIIKKENPQFILFLGDIVDRGQFQLECLLIVLALKILYPNRYYLLRGNHETVEMNKSYGFYTIFNQKYARSDRFSIIRDLYKTIPISAILNDFALCLHGGIPENFEFLTEIQELQLKEVKKNIPDSIKEGIYQIMWNDPKQGLTGFTGSFRGPGIKFYGQDVFEDFMEQNDLLYLVRSHECFPEGYRWFFKGKLLSIFSSKNYRGESMPNPASIAIINDNTVRGKNIF